MLVCARFQFLARACLISFSCFTCVCLAPSFAILLSWLSFFLKYWFSEVVGKIFFQVVKSKPVEKTWHNNMYSGLLYSMLWVCDAVANTPFCIHFLLVSTYTSSLHFASIYVSLYLFLSASLLCIVLRCKHKTSQRFLTSSHAIQCNLIQGINYFRV